MAVEELFQFVAVAGEGGLIHDYQANGSALDFVGAYPERRVEIAGTHGVVTALTQGGAQKSARPLVGHDDQYAWGK